MKIARDLMTLIAFAFAVAPATAAVPELGGIFVFGEKPQFMLVDPDTNETSGWIGVGGTFAGYTVAAFRRETDTIVLTRDGAEVAARLRGAKIKDAPIVAFSGKIQLGAAGSVDVQKVTLVYGEETTFQLADGLTLALKATPRNDGTIAYAARFERKKTDGTREILSAPNVITLPGSPFSVRVGDLGFSLQP
jgi:hypothetical protein